MRQSCTFAITVLVAASVFALPWGATAQEAITTDFSGGIGVPAGDLGDAVDAGPAFTIGLNVPIHDVVSIRAEGGADFFRGKDALTAVVDGTTFGTFEGPDITHARLNAGVVLHAITPEEEDRGLWVDADVGGGIAVLTTETFRRQTGPNRVTTIDESNLYFGLKGGLDLGYRFHESVSAFLAGDAHLALADEDDWQEYRDLQVDPFGSVLSFPFQAGLRFHFRP